VQEQQYPAWSDPMTPRYYVIYALNTGTYHHLYHTGKVHFHLYVYLERKSHNTAASSDLTMPDTAAPGLSGQPAGNFPEETQNQPNLTAQYSSYQKYSAQYMERM